MRKIIDFARKITTDSRSAFNGAKKLLASIFHKSKPLGGKIWRFGKFTTGSVVKKSTAIVGRFGRRWLRGSGSDTHKLLGWGRKGIWLGPIQAFVFCSLVSTMIIFLLSASIMFAVWSIDRNFFDDLYWLMTFGLTMAGFIIAWMFVEKRTVPNNHVVVLEIFGYALPIYLEMGYYLIPSAGILSTNRDLVLGPVYNSQENNIENPGLVYVGTVTVMLDDEQVDGQAMKVIAADHAQDTILPTFNYTCIDPRQRLGRTNPIGDLNKACREVIRKAISAITAAVMTADLQGAIAEVAAGGEIAFVRVRRTEANTGVNATELVMDSVARKPMFLILHPEDKERETKIAAFRDIVLKKGDPDMLDAASAKPKGKKKADHNTIEVTTAYVANAVRDAFLENGYCMDGLPRISEIDIPEAAKAAAARLAAEVKERAAALTEAETIDLSAKKLAESGLSKEDAAMVAVLRESPNTGKVVHLTGSGNQAGVIINTNQN